TPLVNKSSSPEEHILELNNKLLKATRDCDVTNTLKALTQGAKSNNGKGLLEYLAVLSAAQCFDDRILDTLMQHNFSPSARGIL
ncbi:hypothetical protein, partial [Streptococcus pneumoniae]|uniref:hypothetical protein n=1 Tax=Streptococcus pneumoniae TaxID=1313 RepID=UPI001E36EA72